MWGAFQKIENFFVWNYRVLPSIEIKWTNKQIRHVKYVLTLRSNSALSEARIKWSQWMLVGTNVWAKPHVMNCNLRDNKAQTLIFEEMIETLTMPSFHVFWTNEMTTWTQALQLTVRKHLALQHAAVVTADMWILWHLLRQRDYPDCRDDYREFSLQALKDAGGVSELSAAFAKAPHTVALSEKNPCHWVMLFV